MEHQAELLAATDQEVAARRLEVELEIHSGAGDLGALVREERELKDRQAALVDVTGPSAPRSLTTVYGCF